MACGGGPKVYIVGAGPGDPSLITKRALRLIERADSVLYDSLVPVELLLYAKEEAELIPVGKKGGWDQEEINELMVRKALEGKTVVRLKGGDPFIFGRGGEEVEHLRERGVEFEIVPGVSALSAVPAYAGVPLTHRRFSSAVCAVTCREALGKESISWRAISELGGTLVLFMGAGNADDVRERLISSGMDEDTPFVSVMWGTTSEQRTVSGRLGELGRVKLRPPCLTLVGRVALLRERLRWFERKPLFGRTILVARPKEEAVKLAERLREYGARVLPFPAVKFSPLEVDARTLGRALDSDWMAFTSKRGVRFFRDALFGVGSDVRSLRARVAAIGPSTAEELENVGVIPDLVPEEYSSRGLLKEFSRVGVAGKRVVLLRAKGGNPELPSGLERMGADVEDVELYRAVPGGEREAKVLRPLLPDVDTLVFGSPSCLESFLSTFSEEGREALRRGTVVAMGPVTAEALGREGAQRVLVPETFTADGVLKVILGTKEAW